MEAPQLDNQENVGSLTFVDISDQEKFSVLYAREGNARLDGIKDILSVNFVDQFKTRETPPTAQEIRKEISEYINTYRPFDLTSEESSAALSAEQDTSNKSAGLHPGAAQESQQRFTQSLVDDVIRDLGITE
ncbi:hypothetical protein H0W32_03220 [Patescibacteria group bacterium]|nr:hypothetical protein [Patescibacteria group bacterium]